jgi:uncharacterized repeat protein (TIGR01451 family)
MAAFDFNKLYMKKNILLISLLAGLWFQATFTFAANFTPISCSDARINGNSGSCEECFDAGYLYYRSNKPIENITNFYDIFTVTGTGSRIMWQDETYVSWAPLNNKFILGSSLSENRSAPNGFKFQYIPGSWYTAQNPPNTGRIFGIFAASPGGSSYTYVQSPGGISLNGVSNNITPADRNTAMWRITFNAASHNYIWPGQQGPLVNHRQCSFLFGRWCGDGLLDTGKWEQCDDGNMNSGDGCSNVCQTEVMPVCNSLTVTPTSVTNGGTVTYTCSATNATSYSIIARKPDGSVMLSSTSATGSIILPASPAGNYTVSCFINGQVSTPTSCQKTVTNTVPVASCDNLTASPSSVTNGGAITYTCSGTNATSYSIIGQRPDGSTFASSTNPSSTLTILSGEPAGTYTLSCFVNGQVSTPASCQKTVTNTVVNEPVCTGLTVTPSSVTNGGNVTYTCSGNNVTSYSVILKRPDGSTVQTLASATGTLTVPASPDGVYTASCFVNGQTTTPTVCQKSITNTTTTNPVCTGLTVTPSSLTDGGNVNYSCTGTDVSSYSIVFSKPDGTTLQAFSSPTGSISIPATPTGTYTGRCYVNGQTTTPTICEKTITNNGTTVTPAVYITKTDANNADLDGNIGGNDSQTVYAGNAAIFRIRVTNTGTEDLKNITLTDTIAPSCAGGVTLPSTVPSTWSSFITGGAGNHSDALLQPGEYFEYICDRGNTTSNYTNVARVDAQGNISNTPVLDDDPTAVIIQPVTVTTCNDLSVTTSGNTVNYSCTGSGNITGYSILQNGSQISTNASGSVNVINGTHTFVCYVNGSITSTSCQKTVTITPNPTYPQIQVVKDDNDDHDDSQMIQNNGTVQFTVVVRNPGSEPLDSVTLSDPYAPECNRNSAETLNLIVNVWNRDARLDPGESFSYICIRPNTNQGTFPNNENRICVNGRGVTSAIMVNSCDVSRVNSLPPVSLCQDMQITQNGTQTNVSCSPNGGYRLFVLQGRQVLNTLQSPTGQFSFGLNDGTYKVVCLRDGEQNVQPNCQKTVVINPKKSYCTLESSVRFGGAPLRTQLTCSSQTYAQCMIRMDKDGKPWRSIADCSAEVVFTERGIYDATCIVGDAETQSCSTRVQVDIMTIIQTGPFLPVLIFLSLGMAGYITYRRRKTV